MNPHAIEMVRRSWGPSVQSPSRAVASPTISLSSPSKTVRAPASPSTVSSTTTPPNSKQRKSVSSDQPGDSRRPSAAAAEKCLNTECTATLFEADARASIVVNGNVWMAMRDGSLNIRRADGEIVHIIERRQGTYVFCMVEVRGSVWLGCSDGFIRVVSSSTHKLERQFAKHAGGGGGVNALVYHAASGIVFSGSNDFEILAWTGDTYDFIRQYSGHSNAVRCLAVMNNCLLSASDDTTVICWDISTGTKKTVFHGHTKGVRSLGVTEHNVWSGGEDATIRIWNADDGQCVGVAELHTGPVNKLLCIGDRIWSTSGDTVCVWDAYKLKLLGTHINHEGYVNEIVVMSKITTYKLWTMGSDRQVKEWTSETTPDECTGLKKKLDRLYVVDYDNKKLQDVIAQRDAQIEELKFKLTETEAVANRTFELESIINELREAVRVRDVQVQESQSRIEELTNSLQSNTDLLNEQAVQLQQLGEQVYFLKTENQELQAHAGHCTVQVKQLQTETDTLNEQLRKCNSELEVTQSKNKEMDMIFKSRLSLISEIHRMYKRFIELEKKVRVHPAEFREESSTYTSLFKTLISNHFTDNELSHLGTSRHFFPNDSKK